jgi:gamma-glutamylcyclotransferase (GGCT)/AIG2-like uncharacterized protein YtfP
MNNRVFVYGTLRQGEFNTGLLADAVFLGPCQTPPCFTLYSLGAYPGVVARGRTAIVGEVYSVNRVQFAQLDRLEDYPRLYGRRLIPSPWGAAWIYLYRGRLDGARVIPSGDWRVR